MDDKLFIDIAKQVSRVMEASRYLARDLDSLKKDLSRLDRREAQISTVLEQFDSDVDQLKQDYKVFGDRIREIEQVMAKVDGRTERGDVIVGDNINADQGSSVATGRSISSSGGTGVPKWVVWLLFVLVFSLVLGAGFANWEHLAGLLGISPENPEIPVAK